MLFQQPKNIKLVLATCGILDELLLKDNDLAFLATCGILDELLLIDNDLALLVLDILYYIKHY